MNCGYNVSSERPERKPTSNSSADRRSRRILWLVSVGALILALVALLLSQCSTRPNAAGQPTPCPTVTVTVAGTAGLSAYELWLSLGNDGTIDEFMESLVGAPGPAAGNGSDGVDGDTYIGTNGISGPAGEPGESAYQEWLEAGNEGTPDVFLESLVGADGVGTQGPSAYDVWLARGNEGTEQDFLDSLVGADGSDGTSGLSAYEVWLAAGNTGTADDFLISLVGQVGEPGVCTIGETGAIGSTGPAGADGSDGLSAYQVWLSNGNYGTEDDFFDSLQGATGATGATGAKGDTGDQGPAGAIGFGDIGSFYDVTTQGADGTVSQAPDTAYPVYLGQTDAEATDGISVTAGSGDAAGRKSFITFTNDGVYNIAFSAQLYRTQGGSTDTVSFWLRKNGVNVPATSTDVSVLANSTKLVAAWNFLVPVTCSTTLGVTTCDKYQLMWSFDVDYTNIWFEGPQTNPTRPEIPSVILTVNQVQ